MDVNIAVGPLVQQHRWGVRGAGSVGLVRGISEDVGRVLSCARFWTATKSPPARRRTSRRAASNPSCREVFCYDDFAVNPTATKETQRCEGSPD